MLPDRFIPPSLVAPASMAPFDLTEDNAFVPSHAARLVWRPGQATVSRLSVKELPRRGARTIFAHPDFLSAHGVDKVLQVRFAGSEHGPLIYCPVGNHAVYAERTCHLDAELALAGAQALMRHFALDYVLYDSVCLAEQELAEDPFSLRFHFQSDWVMAKPALSGETKMPRPLRQKWSRLLRETGEGRISFSLEQATDRAAFDRIIDWNKEQIEANGGAYGLDPQDREMLWQATVRTGMLARLKLDGQDIAGAIVTVCAAEAYLHVLGYDHAHARHSLGVLVMAQTRKALIDFDIPVMHMLWGDKRHKHDVGAVRVPLHSVLVPRSVLTMFKPSVAHEALRHVWFSVKTALRYRLKPRAGVAS